jgi:type I restriction enzyme R subunit
MRQAIEEGFILDVLQNYTPYKLAFKLAHDGGEGDRRARGRAQRGHEGHHGLGAAAPVQHRQKVAIVVEHFRENVRRCWAGQGQGHGGGRQPAGGGALATGDRQIHQGQRLQHRHAGGLLGRGERPGIRPDPFTENSKALNPNLKGRDIREAFKGDEYQLLLVANKFQTGFDQPLLCGMYVDKRLAASRRCRPCRG